MLFQMKAAHVFSGSFADSKVSSVKWSAQLKHKQWVTIFLDLDWIFEKVLLHWIWSLHGSEKTKARLYVGLPGNLSSKYWLYLCAQLAQTSCA